MGLTNFSRENVRPLLFSEYIVFDFNILVIVTIFSSILTGFSGFCLFSFVCMSEMRYSIEFEFIFIQDLKRT